ncbi:MAG: Na+/H+ antiporter subunit E, partial [Methanoregulaceae archaeon]|nr:Na+/H+ antiporter subunit E [Methanoregulaceae archaeon]
CVAFVSYLILTAGSGSIGLWSATELVMGLLLAIATGLVTRNFLCRSKDYRVLSPGRLLRLLVYVPFPFFVELTKANLDVAYRVITMKIRPGIIRVHSGLRTDLGIFMLANSITLTPGTLSVGIDEKTNDLFIHNINVGEGDEKRETIESTELFSLVNLPSWIQKIAEHDKAEQLRRDL